MTTVNAAAGLYVWEIEYESGEVRHELGSSLDTLISGGSPVIRALRGPAFAASDDAPAVLESLDPPSVKLGEPSFTLRVLGSGFTAGSVILWNGSPEPTAFVSETEITTGVNMATAEVATSIAVAVVSLARQASNVLTFEILPADGAPPARRAERPERPGVATGVQPIGGFDAPRGAAGRSGDRQNA